MRDRAALLKGAAVRLKGVSRNNPVFMACMDLAEALIEEASEDLDDAVGDPMVKAAGRVSGLRGLRHNLEGLRSGELQIEKEDDKDDASPLET
jgi:hypothetical protein